VGWGGGGMACDTAAVAGPGFWVSFGELPPEGRPNEVGRMGVANARNDHGSARRFAVGGFYFASDRGRRSKLRNVAHRAECQSPQKRARAVCGS